MDKGYSAINAKLGQRLIDGGIKLIQFDAAESAKLQKIANDSIWGGAIKNAPDTAPMMRKLLMK